MTFAVGRPVFGILIAAQLVTLRGPSASARDVTAALSASAWVSVERVASAVAKGRPSAPPPGPSRNGMHSGIGGGGGGARGFSLVGRGKNAFPFAIRSKKPDLDGPTVLSVSLTRAP